MKLVKLESGQYMTPQKLCCFVCKTESSDRYHFDEYHKRIHCWECQHYSVSGYPKQSTIHHKVLIFNAPIVIKGAVE